MWSHRRIITLSDSNSTSILKVWPLMSSKDLLSRPESVRLSTFERPLHEFPKKNSPFFSKRFVSRLSDTSFEVSWIQADPSHKSGFYGVSHNWCHTLAQFLFHTHSVSVRGISSGLATRASLGLRQSCDFSSTDTLTNQVFLDKYQQNHITMHLGLILQWYLNVINLFQKNVKDTWVAFVRDWIPMDPDTIRSLRSRIRMDLLPYCHRPGIARSEGRGQGQRNKLCLAGALSLPILPIKEFGLNFY